MNDNAKLWVDVLRSGEFEQQGYGQLRQGDKFCCLGVACELYRRETGDGEWKQVPGYVFALGVGSSEGDLLAPVCDWLGLRDCCGRLVEGSLSERNDNGSSFPEIADLIESEPKGLFA